MFEINTPFGTMARQNEKLARHLVRWHAKFKNCHAGGTLARQVE